MASVPHRRTAGEIDVPRSEVRPFEGEPPALFARRQSRFALTLRIEQVAHVVLPPPRAQRDIDAAQQCRRAERPLEDRDTARSCRRQVEQLREARFTTTREYDDRQLGPRGLRTKLRQ